MPVVSSQRHLFAKPHLYTTIGMVSSYLHLDFPRVEETSGYGNSITPRCQATVIVLLPAKSTYSIPPAAKQERQSPPALLPAPSRSVLHVLEALHDISRSTIPDRLDSAPVTTFQTPLFFLDWGQEAFS